LKHNKKKTIIKNIVIEPLKNKRAFWPKEIKFFNELFDIFPQEDFWENFILEKKIDSLLLLKGESGLKKIKKKFLEYNYVPRITTPIKLTTKSGKDFKINNKPKTIKDFLENE